MSFIKKMGIIIFYTCVFLFSQKPSFAENRVNSPIYDTFEILLKEFKYDSKSFNKNMSKSILLNIFFEGEINPSFKNHVRKSFESLGDGKPSFYFKYCPICSVKRGDTIGKQVYLKKEISDLKEIKTITKNKNVNSYAEVRIIKNLFSLEMKLSFYSPKDGKLVWSKSYKNRMVKIGDFNLTTSFFIRLGWEWEGPTLISFSIGEKVYGVGHVDLNLTIGTPTEGKNENGSPLANPNTSSLNSYFAIGPQLTLNLNDFFNFYSSWGHHLVYTEIGFNRYQRYKITGETKDPEALWGHNFSFGYGVEIKGLVTLTFGFVRGFFFNSDDEFQRYPWVINTGFGFRF